MIKINIDRRKKINKVLDELCNDPLSVKDINQIVNKIIKYDENSIYNALLQFDLFELFSMKSHLKKQESIENSDNEFLGKGHSFLLGFVSSTIPVFITIAFDKNAPMFMLIPLIIAGFILGIICLFSNWSLKKKFTHKHRTLFYLIDYAIEIKKEEFKNNLNEASNENMVEVKLKVNKNNKEEEKIIINIIN